MDAHTQSLDSELLARKFRFVAQEGNSLISRKLPVERVAYKSFHAAHRRAFERLSRIFAKYSIDADRFMAYAINTRGVRTPERMLDVSLFMDYAKDLEMKDCLANVYRSYSRSVENVARECISRKMSPRELILDMVSRRRLGAEYMSGRVSKYFLAAIGGFKNLFDKLDPISKDELRIIYNAAGELNSVLQDASLFACGERARPIASVEAAIARIKNNKKDKETVKQGD